MAVELASAYVTLIPSAKGMSAAIASEMDAPMQAAGKTSGTKFGGAFQTAATVGLVATGALLAKGINDAMEQEQVGANIASALGLDAASAEAQAYGEIAGDLYRNAWGDSLDEVANAVTATVSSFDGLDPASIDRLTERAIALEDALAIGVAESVGTVSTLIGSGLVDDAERGFDLLTAGLQAVPEQLRGEVLDAAGEYGQFFDQIGVSATDMFGVFAAGAKDGQYGIDKAGDAIKEFTIRATDMSTSTEAAYETIGLDAQEMTRKLLAGGEEGEEAFFKITNGLLGIEDPIDQATAALALFGTPLEDLGTDAIPEFLGGIDAAGDSLGEIDGRAQQMADTIGDTTLARFEALKRQGFGALADFAEGSLIPALEAILPVLVEGLELFNDLPQPVKNAALGIGVFALGATALASPVTKMISTIGAASKAFTALALNPWTLVIIAAVALVFIIVKYWDEISAALVAAWEWVSGKAVEIWNSISTFFEQWWPYLIAIFTGPLGIITALVVDHWNLIKATGESVWNGISGFFESTWSFISGLVDTFLIQPVNLLVEIWNALPGAASAAWNGVRDAVVGVVDAVVGAIDRMRTAASDALGPLGKVIDVGAKFSPAGLTKSAFDFVTGIGHSGGVVGGPTNSEQVILTRAGEQILTADQQRTIAANLASAQVGNGTPGASVYNDWRGLIVRDDADLRAITRAVDKAAAGQGQTRDGGLNW